MAMNAVDGMLAREFGQQSPLGAYLNELADVVSDTALYLPFAFVAPFGPWSVGLVIVGVVRVGNGGCARPYGGSGAAVRRADGQKRPRARIRRPRRSTSASGARFPASRLRCMPALALLIGCNIVLRVRRGVAAATGAKR